MRAANPAVGFSRKRARRLPHFRENLTEIFRMSDLLPTAVHRDRLHQYHTEIYVFVAEVHFQFEFNILKLYVQCCWMGFKKKSVRSKQTEAEKDTKIEREYKCLEHFRCPNNRQLKQVVFLHTISIFPAFQPFFRTERVFQTTDALLQALLTLRTVL